MSAWALAGSASQDLPHFLNEPCDRYCAVLTGVDSSGSGGNEKVDLQMITHKSRRYTSNGSDGAIQHCVLRLCLYYNSKPRKHKKKTLYQMFEYIHEVLNEVYLQNFLYGWAVNRETNLTSLLNS